MPDSFPDGRPLDGFRSPAPAFPAGRDVLKLLAGNRDSILRFASSKATFPLGLALVLLTAVARHYDQTWIGERPVLWFLGPLLFSLVSGTWMFGVVYLGFQRTCWKRPLEGPSAWCDWPAFMGLFWMTAPVGWLYALPVERFLDPVASARANVVLLAIVSLWRVLLFSRMVAVTGKARYRDALAWVLVAACAETFAVLLLANFGLAVAKGMAGLRYSPAEDVMMSAVNFAISAAMIAGPVAFVLGILGIAQLPRGSLEPLSSCRKDPLPLRFLAACAAFWFLMALLAQPAVRRSAHLDNLVGAEKYREALDFLGKHSPGDFAPARPLPPKGFEFSTIGDLSGLLAALTPNDPVWVQDHLLGQLDVAAESQVFRGIKTLPPRKPDDYQLFSRDLESARPLLKDAARFPAGRAWLSNNTPFVNAVRQLSGSAPLATPLEPTDPVVPPLRPSAP